MRSPKRSPKRSATKTKSPVKKRSKSPSKRSHRKIRSGYTKDQKERVSSVNRGRSCDKPFAKGCFRYLAKSYYNQIPNNSKVIKLKENYSSGVNAKNVTNNPVVSGKELTIHFPISYHIEYVKTIKTKDNYRAKDLIKDVRKIGIEGYKKYITANSDEYGKGLTAVKAVDHYAFNPSTIKRSGKDIYFYFDT